MTVQCDAEAWSTLRVRLRRFIARRVAAADVEDVLQDVFVRVARGLAVASEIEHLNAWVYRIALHTVTDHTRMCTRPAAAAACEPTDVDEHDDALRDALNHCLADFIAQLPSPYREAISLTELEGLTQAAAAEPMEVSLSGMKSRVQRGREKLREMYAAACDIRVDARGRVVECEPRTCAPLKQNR
jgi:RNA polymerase sigma-70 factor (ECF subfamily)